MVRHHRRSASPGRITKNTLHNPVTHAENLLGAGSLTSSQAQKGLQCFGGFDACSCIFAITRSYFAVLQHSAQLSAEGLPGVVAPALCNAQKVRVRLVLLSCRCDWGGDADCDAQHSCRPGNARHHGAHHTPGQPSPHPLHKEQKSLLLLAL